MVRDRLRTVVAFVHTEVSVWALLAMLLSVAGWRLLNEYVKWRSPGGSALPIGLPAAVLLLAASAALSIAAIRRRPGTLVVVMAIIPLAIVVGCTAYILLFVIG